MEDSLSTWTLATMWENMMGFLAPSFSLAQIWLLQPFRDQWMKVLSFCLSLSLPLSLSLSMCHSSA